MLKAVLLALGVIIYLAATRIGYSSAQTGLLDVDKLYTQATTQAAVISAANR